MFQNIQQPLQNQSLRNEHLYRQYYSNDCETESESESDSESESESDSKSESESDSKSESESDSKSESESETESETESESDSKSESDSESESESDLHYRQAYLAKNVRPLDTTTSHLNYDCIESSGFFSMFSSKSKNVPKVVNSIISKKVPKPIVKVKPNVTTDDTHPKDKYKNVPSLGTHYLDKSDKVVELKKGMCYSKTLGTEVTPPKGYYLREGGYLDRIPTFANKKQKPSSMWPK